MKYYLSLMKLILEQEKSKYTWFCDMDGVLVNFEKGYHKLTGRSIQQAKTLPPDQFWAPVTEAGKEFWENLEWMPDGRALWDYIKIYNPVLLSSPSRDESSRWGKSAWVKKHIPGTDIIFKQATDKKQYSCPTCVMIDDRKDVIDGWKEHSGIGVHHTSTKNTIIELQKLGL